MLGGEEGVELSGCQTIGIWGIMDLLYGNRMVFTWQRP